MPVSSVDAPRRIGIVFARPPIRHSFSANIGQAIAFGVGAADARGKGQIDAKTVGRRKTGTFANQHRDELRAKNFANFVANRHTAVFNNNNRRELP